MSTSPHTASTEHSSSSTRPPNRRERKRAETRERIVRAALHLFCEREVVATTIEDITNAADIGKGTFFNYFPSKEHILAHLCRLQMGKIRECISDAIDSGEPMERVFNRLALILTEEFGRCPTLVPNVLIPSFASEAMRRQMADNLHEDRLLVAELIAARQKSGEIRGDLSPTELALQFQQALFGTTVVWSLNPSKPLADCLRKMSNILWSGIRAEATAEERKSLGSRKKSDRPIRVAESFENQRRMSP
ncbi:MAG: TetR/AcrR family transcriptional regulator [Thermodesulfobacteriota bacterium]